MTEPTRAERRRMAREKEWTPHDPAQHQFIGTPAQQVARHTDQCSRCKSGAVATLGCPWLRKFFLKHQDTLGDLFGSGIYLDEMDEYHQRKLAEREAALAEPQDEGVRTVIVGDEDPED